MSLSIDARRAVLTAMRRAIVVLGRYAVGCGNGVSGAVRHVDHADDSGSERTARCGADQRVLRKRDVLHGSWER